MPNPDYLDEALDALVLHEPEYQRASDYFLGVIEEAFSSQRLRALIGPTGHRYRVNFARTPVDVLSERTNIAGIECSDAAALALLNAVWDANDLDIEAKDLHRLAYEFGDAYLIGWPSDTLEGGVEVYAHDPRCVRVFYDAQQPRIKSHAIHTWVERGGATNGLGQGLWQRVALYFPDYVEQWVSTNRIDQGDSSQGREYSPYDIEGNGEGIVDNPTPGLIPVFHFRNGRPYGRPEHVDAYGPQDMINKTNITMMSAIDFSGFPQRYVLTDSALNPLDDQDAFGPPPDDTLSIDEGLPGIGDQSQLRAGPGETWFLSGANLSVGQFQVADTGNFLKATESLIKQMASVCDIPAHYFDRSGQMPSGESFRRAEAPLNKKLDDRLQLFGAAWHEFLNYCLVLNGQAETDAYVTFDPPEVASDKESWDTAMVQQSAGVSVEQTLKERGYDDKLIAEFLGTAAPPEAEVPVATEAPEDPTQTVTQTPQQDVAL